MTAFMEFLANLIIIGVAFGFVWSFVRDMMD